MRLLVYACGMLLICACATGEVVSLSGKNPDEEAPFKDRLINKYNNLLSVNEEFIGDASIEYAISYDDISMINAVMLNWKADYKAVYNEECQGELNYLILRAVADQKVILYIIPYNEKEVGKFQEKPGLSYRIEGGKVVSFGPTEF